MNEAEQLEARIHDLEAYAEASPAAYHARLALLGLLGYGFLFLVLAMVAGSLALLIYAGSSVHGLGWIVGKLAWAILIVAVIVVRSMWVRIPEPEGIEITRREAPRLFEMLDAVRVGLRAPRADRVLIDTRFNASIVQVPRLGVFGWPRNRLILGLPLMMGLGPEALRAVVAHEFGHLSGNHGAFGAWIYRIRATWERVLAGLEQQEAHFDFGLRSFFRWYVPYFDTHSFVLARAQEYVADACAAEVTSRRAACETLVGIEVLASYMEHSVWPALLGRAADEPEPPRDAFHDVRAALEKGPPAVSASRSLASALRRPTGHEDTHPSLADRLRALDPEGLSDPRSIETAWRAEEILPQVSSAEHFLEGSLDRLLERMDLDWHRASREGWQHQHRVIQTLRADLAELDRAATERELTQEEFWNRVQATQELRGPEDGVAVLRAYTTAYPRHGPGRFMLGRLLLHMGAEGGRAEIEAAMDLDPELVPSGVAVVEQYLHSHGRDAEAKSWLEHARSYAQAIEAARREREELHADDCLLPHGLSSDTLRALGELFAVLPLRRVLLARKRIEHYPDSPVWVMGFSVRPRHGLLRSRDLEAEVFERLQAELGEAGDHLFFVIEDNAEIAEAVGKVDGAIVHPA